MLSSGVVVMGVAWLEVVGESWLEEVGKAWLEVVGTGLAGNTLLLVLGVVVVRVVLGVVVVRVVVVIEGGLVDLYLTSVTANIALLASMRVTGVWRVAGRVSVVVVMVVVVASCVVVLVAVSISSSDSLVVSSSPAMVSGSSSGTFIQNSQLSSKSEMESTLSSMTVGVIVAVGSECVLVECSGKVSNPLVP